jgi:hypothetical protein
MLYQLSHHFAVRLQAAANSKTCSDLTMPSVGVTSTIGTGSTVTSAWSRLRDSSGDSSACAASAVLTEPAVLPGSTDCHIKTVMDTTLSPSPQAPCESQVTEVSSVHEHVSEVDSDRAVSECEDSEERASGTC